MNSTHKIEILLNGGASPLLSQDALESLNHIAFCEANRELNNRVREIAHPEDPESSDDSLDSFLRDAANRKYLD